MIRLTFFLHRNLRKRKKEEAMKKIKWYVLAIAVFVIAIVGSGLIERWL